METYLLFGILFLDCLLEPFHLLAHLRKRLLCGIGFLCTFLGSREDGFFRSVFLRPTTILGIVRGTCSLMFLAKVVMFLGVGFLGNSACRIGNRSLDTFFALVRSFLVGLCIGFSWVYTCSIASRDKGSKHMSMGVIPFLCEG
jgi:hypothetical protein